MARSFNNSFKNSSGNKVFAVFLEPQDAGEYIYNKKARATYCVANNCVPRVKVGSESNLLLFNRSNKLSFYPCKNAIDKTQLYINLITHLDLSGVPVIQNFQTGAIPSTISTASGIVPYLDYNIDPSGSLFGNDICGVNNYVSYMVYSNRIPLTATPITPQPVDFNGSLRTATVLANPNGTYTGSLTASGIIPGTYTSSITGTGLYTGTVQGGNFVINNNSIPLTATPITPNPVIYTGSLQTAAVLANPNGTYTGSLTASGTCPGTYTSSITGTGLYTGTVQGGNFVINFVPIIGTFIYTFNYTGGTPFNTIPSSSYMPIINQNISFVLTPTITNVNNFITVSVSFVFTDNGSNDGLSFFNVNNFYNSNTNSLTITQFDSVALSPESSQFADLNSLTFTASDSPSILCNTSLTSCFQNSLNFNSNISNWNTSTVTDMSDMFNNAQVFNQNISDWDTGSVIDMSNMFRDANLFNNGDTGNNGLNALTWNTGNVVNMFGMFFNAHSFNQNISSLDISSVTDMSVMFSGANLFNNGDTGNNGLKPLNWTNTNSLTNVAGMFNEAVSFNQHISTWNTININTTSGMFYGAHGFNNGDTGNNGLKPLYWNTTNLIGADNMFAGAISFNQYIGNWNTPNLNSINSIFFQATIFNNGDVGNNSLKPFNWNTTNVDNMNNMFNAAIAFNQDISSFNTINVKDMSAMFYGAVIFNKNIGGFNTVNVKYMNNMFYGATIFNQNIGGWNTGSVTDMSYMFFNATTFNQDISTWTVAQVTNHTDFATNCPIDGTSYSPFP